MNSTASDCSFERFGCISDQVCGHVILQFGVSVGTIKAYFNSLKNDYIKFNNPIHLLVQMCVQFMSL